MPDVLITLGIALTCVALDDWIGTTERSVRQRRVQERAHFSEHSLYQRYYADSGIPIHELMHQWREVARILRVDAGRLRPEDTLEGVLGFHRKLRGSRSDVEQVLKLVRQKLEDGSVREFRGFRTVDDVVRGLCAARQRRYMLATA